MSSATQPPLFEHETEITGGHARSEAGLCAVNGCCYKPVQIDRWGWIFCAAHRWRDDEQAGQRAI